MSDQSLPPPKPKPGSLRDRIAAFEKSASSAPQAPAPAPRPKPAGFASWKPKAPTPPESPSAASTEHAASTSRAAGMSASDAKESISKAGSLKDRMAALQGKGAFGAPPPIAPKPAVEKPKWKPPPVVHAPADDDDQSGASGTAAIAAAVERVVSPPASLRSLEAVDVPAKSPEEGQPEPTSGAEGVSEDAPAEADPEEEERQRRAAIAARMARLGGARVGMAPPVFGKKPPVRRPTDEAKPKSDEPSKPTEATPEVVKSPEAQSPPEVQSPPIAPVIVASPPTETPLQEDTEANVRQSSEYFPVRKNSENASVLSAESAGSQSARSPSSMPVPAVPRRAGPPRKKPAKAVPPPPSEVVEEKTAVVASPPVPQEETEAAQAAPLVAEQSLPEKQEEVKELTEAEVEPEPLDKSTDPKPPPAAQSAVGESTDNSPKAELHEEIDNKPTLEEKQEEVKTLTEEAVEPEALDEARQESVLEAEEEEAALEPATAIVPSDTSSPSPPLEKEPSGIASPPPSRVPEPEDEEIEEAFEDSEMHAASPPVAIVPSPPQQVGHDVVHEPEGSHKDELPAAETAPEQSEEDEEEARKKRIAERLAKMGGVNPFAPPPQVRSPPLAARSPPAPPSAEEPKSLASPPPSFREPIRKAEDEENVAESIAEEEAFDEEGLEEDDVLPYDRASNKPERPVSPPLPHSEPRRQSLAGPPPLPPSSTRPPVPVQQYEQEDDEASDYGEAESEEEEEESAPAPPPRPISFAQHPSAVHSPPHEEARLTEAASPPPRPAQPPRRIVPQAPEPTEEEQEEAAEEEEVDEEADERLASSQLFVPPPSSRGPIAIPRHVQADAEEDGNGSESDVPALPVPHRRSMEIAPGRPIPPPPPVHGSLEEDSEPESDHDGRALPIPPRHSSGPPPRLVPPPPPPHPPAAHSPPVGRDSVVSPTSSEHLTPAVSISESEEILDEEEGDPIDPSFHSPSRRASFASIHAAAQDQEAHSAEKFSPPLARSPPAPPAPAMAKIASEETEKPEEEDPEQARRKTIAERMARLGGIKFGAAPPLPTPASRPPPPVLHEEQEQGETESAPAAEEEQPAALSEEEEERARKERIAAKLASMGGMRIGMMPMGMGGLPPQRSHVLREEASNAPPAPPAASPPTRAAPPARPPPPPAAPPAQPESDSEYGSVAASDDGVKVEAEESEMEEVGYEDAQEEHEEEAPPPPVPSRFGRAPSRQVSVDKPTTPITPSIPSPRPPVPSGMPARRSSVQTNRSSTSNSGFEGSIQRKSSAFVPPTQSEYVMVEEPEQEAPPPPPARPTSRLPPARATPQVPPPPPVRTQTSDTHDWELPNIPTPSVDFGEGVDLSLSWSDAGEPTSPATSAPPPPMPTKKPSLPPAPPAIERTLTADELIALWGRVGVQVCEVATTLYERSKKSLIGDGTYAGFVQSVIASVPNAAPVSGGGYGYLIYAQHGASVQKRLSEIMPGDIVEIQDAKFKGHKGLQTYHQNVGGVDGEVLVGVVGEFEAKKSKIRVFQANQHVGQQTVESVSYRLEDLKSGLVKVYRVLDAQ